MPVIMAISLDHKMFLIGKSRVRIRRSVTTWLCLILACQLCCSFAVVLAEQKSSPNSLTVLVMDPLSAPLACDCVQGYAQRKYELLGEYLQRSLKKPVKVVWSESVSLATKEHGPADIIIGKHSVVQFNAKKANQKIRPIAQLTGRDGKVTQTGLIVVRKDDKATSVADLKGYRILFGPEDCDEKHAAVVALLESAGIEKPSDLEISAACSEAAAQLMELDSDVAAAAVISSYAKPLLAGCGAIKEGDLRVIAESETVPFITAFVSASLPKQDKQAIRTALLDVELEPALMIALETSEGFKKWVNAEPSSKKKSREDATAAKALKKKMSK